MSRLAAILACVITLALCAPVFAVDPALVSVPNLNLPDKSGELGRQINYLCLRQLGADCRDRLVFGKESYLKDLFIQAKPGQRMSEHQIRPLAGIVYTSAALLTFGDYDEEATSISRRDMGLIAVSLIRELSAHHISNTDKSTWWWGNEWQSAYWTASLGTGAWLLWDRLPASTQQMTANMIVYEADRFLASPAPHNEFSDTKAEENAWDSEILVLAACMMPNHPNRAAWDEKAIEYMVTSFATPEDVKSDEVVDGKPLKDWLAGPNVHSDYTLENHGFFHPDYETSYFLTLLNMPVYAMAGREAPQSMFHNVAKLREILTFLTLPNGWTYYPQYTDWSNYRHEVTIMAQFTNPVMPDAVGARCLRWALDFLSYSDSLNAGKPSPNLFRGLNFNCCPLETLGHVYALHYVFGPGAEPVSDEQAREQLCGTRLYEQGNCVICRSKDAMASFSWFDSGKRLMACVTPMASDCIALPKYRSLIGTVGGKIDDAKIVSRETRLLDGGGYIVKLALQRGPDFGLSEKVTMVALPDGRTIWAERFDAQPADGIEVRASLVYPESNPYWLRGVTPKVYHAGGTWEAGSGPTLIKDVQWLNMSDRFGMVIRGSRVVSIEDGQLALNYRAASGGEFSRYSVVVFYPNVNRRATMRLNERVKVTGLDGGNVTVDLGDCRFEM